MADSVLQVAGFQDVVQPHLLRMPDHRAKSVIRKCIEGVGKEVMGWMMRRE